MDPTNRIAILLFHPLLHKSRVNRQLVSAVSNLEGVTLRVMYDLYPEYYINIKVEQISRAAGEYHSEITALRDGLFTIADLHEYEYSYDMIG